MDHAVIEETQLAERYVAGTLSDAERSRFEEHFLDCPGCLDRLEAAQGLRASLKDLASARLLASAQPSESSRPDRRTRRLAYLAAAAALAAGVSASLLYFQARRTSLELAVARGAASKAQSDLERARTRLRPAAPLSAPAPALPVAAPVFVLNLTRGPSDRVPENRIAVSKSTSWVTVIFDRPAWPRAAAYRVRLMRDGDPIPVVEAATGSATAEMLSATLPARLLSQGDYSLTVAADPERSGAAATYRLRVAAGH